jgi:hypothetical protein
VLQASNFAPGHADIAIHSVDIYLREVVANEEELRATYAQAGSVLRKKLNRLSDAPVPDTVRGADSATPHLRPSQ